MSGLSCVTWLLCVSPDPGKVEKVTQGPVPLLLLLLVVVFVVEVEVVELLIL